LLGKQGICRKPHSLFLSAARSLRRFSRGKKPSKQNGLNLMRRAKLPLCGTRMANRKKYSGFFAMYAFT